MFTHPSLREREENVKKRATELTSQRPALCGPLERQLPQFMQVTLDHHQKVVELNRFMNPLFSLDDRNVKCFCWPNR